ncbi:hypothetical protein ACKXGF_02990 [Alkalibacillus sp. S2W]|uniref:hypothetical protein n=1 Tax=Alkalibacillus sp. S2W TaxID=3386553 RepID=UPI00398C9819
MKKVFYLLFSLSLIVSFTSTYSAGDLSASDSTSLDDNYVTTSGEIEDDLGTID